MSERIRKNKKVAIIYSMMNCKGEIIMEVSPDAPIFYLHGCGNKSIVPGLESALEGHVEGDVFSVELPCKMAFGPYNQNLVIEVAKEELTPFIDDFWVGDYIESLDDEYMEEMSESERFFKDIEEQQEPHGYIIREIRKNTVILDGNHPYAGVDLIFNVKVASVSDASIMELENGYPKESEEYYEDDDYEDDDYCGDTLR